MKLGDYSKKRDFQSSPEPMAKESRIVPLEGKQIFVVQEHHARKLHYDFRLEDRGALRSWAVPKGPSLDPSDKRLAVETEDHPLEYADFEGVIPEGNYGAGKVIVWDAGYYVNITVKKGVQIPLSEAHSKGHFIIYLKGEKLNGSFAFTRTREKEWIFVKADDEHARKDFDMKSMPGSVLDRIIPPRIERQISSIRISNPDKEIFKGIRKSEFLDYYARISPMMLRHVRERPVTLKRFPDGISGDVFYQKSFPRHYPSWLGSFSTKTKKKQNRYPVCQAERDIIYLASQVGEFHISQFRRDIKDRPDKLVFDLDPAGSNDSLRQLKRSVLKLKRLLEQIGFVPYVMTTGGKGYHLAVPIERDSSSLEARDFAGTIAEVFERDDPGHITTELLIRKRKGRIFIDVNRNSPEQTSVAPYSVRAKAGATVAMPILWEDFGRSRPDSYTLKNAAKIARENGDPWFDFFDKKASIKDVIRKLKS